MKKITLVLIAIAMIVAACSRSPKRYIESGKKYFAEKNYKEAGLELMNALKKDPQSVEAHSNMGLVYIAVGQLDKAFQEYQRVVSLDPNRLDA